MKCITAYKAFSKGEGGVQNALVRFFMYLVIALGFFISDNTFLKISKCFSTAFPPGFNHF